MPSAMVGNAATTSAIPDLGNGSHNETMKQIFNVIDKKVRNMEKKKSKLDDYQTKKNKGERLNQDQLDALTKYQEVINNLEFARELQKSFVTLGQEVQKAVKKTARREQLQREELEQRRLKTVLELQFILDQLGEDQIRQDLKRPDASGASLLTDADLASLDEFYKLVGPDRSCDVRLTDQYEPASLHLWELLEGRDKAVAGTTYKSLKDTLHKVLHSGYFDRAQAHPNGTCQEEEEQEEPPATAESQDGPQPSETGTQRPVYAQMVNTLQHQPPSLLTPEPPIAVNHVTPTPPSDPVVRKQVVQDLMAQMQGTYNFMQFCIFLQDSMLEFDGQALDPAIVSAQPMKPGQTVDLQQLGCPTSELHSVSYSVIINVPSCLMSLYLLLHRWNRNHHTLSLDRFLSCFQVFNIAPVPPASDGPVDSLKQPSQFPGGYGQGFGSQAERTVDQADIPQETLQSVVGGFQTQDQVMASAGGSEDSSASFGQPGQSFYNSRAVPRGGPRNPRGVMNGYRGSSNGFRGGYEGYRPSFSNAPSGGYGQTQFNNSRDYSNNTYQREGYQNYKRGAAQGPRGLSRGNTPSVR
uniref:Cell cycle associated protein 1a n=1 Tax=Takifugu rubripes TaxID=31033 RepID=H2V528_TAKRU